MDSRKPLHLAHYTCEPYQGAEETIPIIFLHGITLSKEDWGDIPQITANATGRMVYAIDARNHGDSEWTDCFDSQNNTDDLLFYMDRMNIQKAILVGHNMGAITAMRTALRNPDRVEKLIIEEMPINKYSDNLISSSIKFLTLAREALKMVQADSSIDEAKYFIGNFAFHHLPQKLRFREEYEDSDGRLVLTQTTDGHFEFKCNLGIVLPKFQEINNDLSLIHGTYKGPSCFIYGRNSPNLIGQDEYEIRKLFPNVKLVSIKDASHEVHKRFPLPFTEALLTFIQGGWNKKIYPKS